MSCCKKKFLNRLSWVTRKNLQPSHLNPADSKLIKMKKEVPYSAFLQAMRAAEEQKAREEEQRRWVLAGLRLTSLVLIENMYSLLFLQLLQTSQWFASDGISSLLLTKYIRLFLARMSQIITLMFPGIWIAGVLKCNIVRDLPLMTTITSANAVRL